MTYYVSITGHDLADQSTFWRALSAKTLMGAKRQATHSEGQGFGHHVIHVGAESGRCDVDTGRPEIRAIASRQIDNNEWCACIDS